MVCISLHRMPLTAGIFLLAASIAPFATSSQNALPFGADDERQLADTIDRIKTQEGPYSPNLLDPFSGVGPALSRKRQRHVRPSDHRAGVAYRARKLRPPLFRTGAVAAAENSARAGQGQCRRGMAARARVAQPLEPASGRLAHRADVARDSRQAHRCPRAAISMGSFVPRLFSAAFMTPFRTTIPEAALRGVSASLCMRSSTTPRRTTSKR